MELVCAAVLLICVERTDDSVVIEEFVTELAKCDCFVALLTPTNDDVIDSDVLQDTPSDKLDRSVVPEGARKLSNSSKLETTLEVEFVCWLDTLESSPLLEALDCSRLNVDLI